MDKRGCAFPQLGEETTGRPDLRLVFEREGEKTILVQSFSRMPLRSFPPFYSGRSCAYTYVVNPTPGFLGGDRVRQEIVLGRGAHAFVTTPSATKVMGSGGSRAEQTIHIHVHDGACLEYLPSYTIPFAKARYAQQTVVKLGSVSTCMLLDWFTTGRTSRGESLEFDEYESSILFVSGDEPVIYDRFVLSPKDEQYQRFGRLGSCTVSASLYLVCDRPDLSKDLLKHVREALPAESNLSGVTAVDSKGLVVRVIGQRVPDVQVKLIRVIGVIRKILLGVDDDELLHRMLTVQ